MKKFTVLAISLIASGTIYAQAEKSTGVTVSRLHGLTVYKSSCQYNAPLSTWDRCSEHSYIGAQAIDCATDEAMDKCQDDPNVDCVISSVKVTPVISREFVGYKLCLGQAVVHGYSVR